MVAPTKLNFKVYQGSTFSETLRWESAVKVFKTISNITQAAPAVITSAGHGVPVGWRIKVSNVLGMKEINSTEYVTATTATSSMITLGDINAMSYTAYVSGGVIEYQQPVVLTGMTARMQIREKVSSTDIIQTLTTENGMITLDNANSTITISIPALTTTDYTFKTAVYSIEMVNGSIVTPLAYGTLTLEQETTR